MKTPSKRTRLADVAKRARVSRAAASLILNGKGGNFRSETRDRVLSAAKELGYSPEPLARACGRLNARNLKREMHIGFLYRVVEGGFRSTYIFETFSGLIQAIQPQRGLVISIPVNVEAEKDAGAAIPPLLLSHEFDGVVIMSDAVTPAIRHFLHSREIPAVLLDNQSDWPFSSCVRIDNAGGSLAAARHLLEQGYPQVAVIAGNPQIVNGEDRSDTRERVEGVVRALKAVGRAWREELLATGDFNIEGGRRGATQLLDRLSAPLGIICPNDRAAIGALQECQRRGLRVPEDVGLVGFDDLSELTETVQPTLSSVRVPWGQLGLEAGQRILSDLLEPRQERVILTCPVHLIVRESSTLSKQLTGLGQRRIA